MYVLSSLPQSRVAPLYLIYRIVPGNRKNISGPADPRLSTQGYIDFGPLFLQNLHTRFAAIFFYQNEGFDLKT